MGAFSELCRVARERGHHVEVWAGSYRPVGPRDASAGRRVVAIRVVSAEGEMVASRKTKDIDAPDFDRAAAGCLGELGGITP